MKINKKNILYYTMMFAFFFYGYARSFLFKPVVNNVARFGIYFTLILIIFFATRKRIIGYTHQDILFLITCIVPVVSLMGKDQLGGQRSETIAWTVIYATGILMIIILRNNDRIAMCGIKVLTLYSAFYVFCTFFFLMFPSLFRSSVVGMFSPDSQATVLKTFNSGYMCGFTSHYSTNGMYLSIASCVSLGILINQLYISNGKAKLKYWLGFIICLMALGLTGKRGPFAMIIFACVLTLYLFYSDRPKTRMVKFATYAFVAFMGSSVIAAVFPAALNSVTRMLEYLQADSGNDLLAGRGVLYELAIQMFLRNPLFGCGWARYKRESPAIAALIGQANNGTTLQAHNVFLQLLAETGIVGCFIFILPFMICFFRTLHLYYMARKDRIVLPENGILFLSISVCYQIYFWFYAFTGNPLYDICTLFPLLFCVMLSINVDNKSKRNE